MFLGLYRRCKTSIKIISCKTSRVFRPEVKVWEGLGSESVLVSKFLVQLSANNRKAEHLDLKQ